MCDFIIRKYRQRGFVEHQTERAKKFMLSQWGSTEVNIPDEHVSDLKLTLENEGYDVDIL